MAEIKEVAIHFKVCFKSPLDEVIYRATIGFGSEAALTTWKRSIYE